ncbi:hypothetical protein CPC08DRAFT_790222 [Agrocybe pediades]|nr:hypothetical protein CPC08DRAFT_790222 [Agrocybe pediades]
MSNHFSFSFMSSHFSFLSLIFPTSSTLPNTAFESPTSSLTRTPSSFNSNAFLKSPSKVHSASLPSRYAERNQIWVEMLDMEKGRYREPCTREGEGDWKDIPVAPGCTNSEAPALDHNSDHYAASYPDRPRSPPLPLLPPSMTIASKMSLVWQYFIGILCTLYTFGICHLYFDKFRMKAKGNSISSRTSSIVGVDPTHEQWLKVVRKMCGIWRLARVGCGLLLPLSIALLQIEGVVTTVFAKTCAISTAIFAGTGVLSSAMFLFCRKQLSGGENREKWKEASKGPTGLRTAVFWTCLALPLTTLLCIVCIVWIRHSDAAQGQRTSFIASAVFVTFLSVISVLYKGTWSGKFQTLTYYKESGFLLPFNCRFRTRLASDNRVRTKSLPDLAQTHCPPAVPIRLFASGR